jgi:hypothetical protein
MMTIEDMEAILASCKAPEITFLVKPTDSCVYLQVQFTAWDTADRSKPAAEWRGRKWSLSPHMTRSELIRTAFMAYHAALEHEARESFTYDGRAVFGPHIDVDVLWAAAVDLDRRADLR